MTTDLAVLGSGAAGLTAAWDAARSGLKTLLVESTARFGGATAPSGSGVWIPANAAMRDAGSGVYPAGGLSLGPALTFGYITARALAASASGRGQQ